MITKKERIISEAVRILQSNPNGIRQADLRRKVHNELPEITINTIRSTIWNLETHVPNEAYKPAQGVLRHVRFREVEVTKEPIRPEGEEIKEENFYKPFSDWLVNEVEECTKAIALGGSRFRDKWGTPDVIGKRERLRSDIIKAPTEIVSAEIKADTRDLITAFGQACSYKLFSHKSYIVIPKNSSQEDISKLDALCLIFGIGLVLFDSSNVSDPLFEIRVRPLKHEPDMFYVNKYMKLIEKELFG